VTKKILSVFGTRPEAIKMAPVVLKLAQNEKIESKICVTAQHREMLDSVLDLFQIRPDFDLDLMSPGQDLFDITTKVLNGVGDVIRKAKPDVVLVHGDTTSCFAAALAAFYLDVPVGHVEAGLRTGNMRAPFPEEANRSLVGRLAQYHFAPTKTAEKSLLAENVSPDKIWVTGNTVIDSLLMTREKLGIKKDEYWEDIFGSSLFDAIINSSRKLILITGHRRENFGQGFIDLCTAIKQLALAHSDWDLVYPVHLNPNVQQPVKDTLSGIKNIHLIEPLSYEPFVWLMDQSDLVLTDSGGIQEEAPSLGKPVLVMRDVTERPEALDAGTVRLVGTDTKQIVDNIEQVLLNDKIYNSMSTALNPYGDGKAADRIVDILLTGSFT